MAAPIRIEAQRQAMPAKHLLQGAKRRGRPFLLHQKGRVDRARGIVHGHDQIEGWLPQKPFGPGAVLVQHHALERLALAFAAMRPTSGRTCRQTCRLQLCLRPGVAPAEAVIPHQVLVKMLHVPTPIGTFIELLHQSRSRLWHSLG